MILQKLAIQIGGKVLQATEERAAAGRSETDRDDIMEMMREFVDLRLDAIARAEALEGLSARRRAKGRGVHKHERDQSGCEL